MKFKVEKFEQYTIIKGNHTKMIARFIYSTWIHTLHGVNFCEVWKSIFTNEKKKTAWMNVLYIGTSIG